LVQRGVNLLMGGEKKSLKLHEKTETLEEETYNPPIAHLREREEGKQRAASVGEQTSPRPESLQEKSLHWPFFPGAGGGRSKKRRGIVLKVC